jgi:hypothetical protein
MKNHKMRRSLKPAGMVAVGRLHSTIRAVKGLVDMPLGTRNIAGMALIADNTANVYNITLITGRTKQPCSTHSNNLS